MPTLVRRHEMPSVQSIVVDNKEHKLGLLKDFRSHERLNEFLSPDLKLSMSWVHLDPGEELQPHVHPVDSMIIVCHGTGLSLGDLPGELSDGDVFVVPRGHQHGFKGTGELGFWALSIQFEPRSLYENGRDPLVRFVADAADTKAHEGHLIDRLLMENERYLQRWRQHRLFKLIEAGRLDDHKTRERFLDCLQIWSNQFQRLVMLRATFGDDPLFRDLAEAHLIEEFGHNRLLQQDRQAAQPIWDPLLESTSQWFVAQMMSLDDGGRTVLVHLVLEKAGVIAYPQLERLLPHGSQSHYSAHVEGAGDERHVQMGIEALRKLPLRDFARFEAVLARGWEMMFAMFERMADLALAACPAERAA
jgi:quercetin dioxygenase-like cupin family protein